MRKVASLFTLTALFALSVVSLPAQGRKSPHEKVEATHEGKPITIEYGRPSKKGRKIFGGLVPYGKVWRTGADERTLITLPTDVMFGSLHVPAGSYSLWTVPGEKEWQLVVNKQAKGWGADWDYETKIKPEEVGRAPMKVSTIPAVEQFTIKLLPRGENHFDLVMEWDTTRAVLDVMMH
ncbi:MAG: DUF2911 domain-containing protein [Bryobacter sp.]|nr:DUF2911 domain-containing protein [Bryobacter sp.]